MYGMLYDDAESGK